MAVKKATAAKIVTLKNRTVIRFKAFKVIVKPKKGITIAQGKKLGESLLSVGMKGKKVLFVLSN
jgi:hypothetical protein